MFNFIFSINVWRVLLLERHVVKLAKDPADYAVNIILIRR
jgi:hypothetical protein